MNAYTYAHKTNRDTWADHTHEELVTQLIGEIVAADAREQRMRELHEFTINSMRRWAAGVWADNRRGARVIDALHKTQKAGRKTVRVADLLAIADQDDQAVAA